MRMWDKRQRGYRAMGYELVDGNATPANDLFLDRPER